MRLSEERIPITLASTTSYREDYPEAVVDAKAFSVIITLYELVVSVDSSALA